MNDDYSIIINSDNPDHQKLNEETPRIDKN